MFKLLIFFVLLFIYTNVSAATYYVRNGGGTTTQCTGLSDVDYDGSGSGEACAFSNFQNAWNATSCGDTVALAKGQSFLGSFTLTAKGCSGTYITITTNDPSTIPAQLSQYPSLFRWNSDNTITVGKMNPTLAADMPKIKASSSFAEAAITFASNSSYVKIVGVEITSDDTVFPGEQYNYLIIGGESGILSELPHHVEFSQVYIHPPEEDGTLNNIVQRSVESGILFNGSYFTLKNSACYGFTGWNKYPAPGGEYRLDAKCLLLGNGPEDASNVIESNLLGANGNIIFMGGSGGFPNPAHTATLTSITMNADGSGSATFSSTTNLNIGDLFAVFNETYSQHYINNIPAQLGAPWVVGGVIGKTGNTITWDFLAGGFRYRQNVIIPQLGITGGTFTLTHNGQTTAPITYDPSSWSTSMSAIQSALEGLSNINPGDVNVIWNNDYGMVVNMQGQYTYPNQAFLVTVNDAGLTGTPIDPSLPKMYRNNGPSEGFEPVELPDIPSNGAFAQWDGYIPTGHLIKKNIFDMPDEWRTASCPTCPGGIVGEVKGFIEVKQGNNITIDGNIFSNRNTGFIITPINQGNGPCCPWTQVSNFVASHNIWTESGANVIPFLMEQGQRTVISTNYDIFNNVTFWPIGHKVYEADGTIFRTTQISDVRIDHNTLFVESHIGINYGGVLPHPPVPGLLHNRTIPMVFTNNLIFSGAYYPWGCTDGVFQIDCWPVDTTTVDKNLIVNLFEPNVAQSEFDALFSNWPVGWYSNTIPSGLFLNTAPTATQDYGGITGRKWTMFDPTINPTSIYAAGGSRQASDGKDVGADIEAIKTVMGFDPFTGNIVTVKKCNWHSNVGCEP